MKKGGYVDVTFPEAAFSDTHHRFPPPPPNIWVIKYPRRRRDLVEGGREGGRGPITSFFSFCRRWKMRRGIGRGGRRGRKKKLFCRLLAGGGEEKGSSPFFPTSFSRAVIGGGKGGERRGGGKGGGGGGGRGFTLRQQNPISSFSFFEVAHLFAPPFFASKSSSPPKAPIPRIIPTRDSSSSLQRRTDDSCGASLFQPFLTTPFTYF